MTRGEETFRAELALIERVIGSICRRKCCRGDEAEDFRSWAMLKLIEDDYGRLRKFQGKSSLSTFLNTALHRLFLDYRTQKWGRWRPSAKAKRLGEAAVHLETLTSRDGLEFREAIEILVTNHRVDETRDELEALAAKLPRRPRRHTVGEEALERLGSSDGVEKRVRDTERSVAARRVGAAVNEGLRDLTPEDRLLLKLRFQDGFTIADVARSLHLEQRPLYDRFKRLEAGLRESLEAAGVTREALAEVLEWDLSDVTVDYDAARRPIEEEE